MASKKGKDFKASNSLLVAVIGDEATVTGFLLAGIGEKNKKGQTNFFVVDKDTHKQDIINSFTVMSQRDDIGVILICQHIANEIKDLIIAHTRMIPTIMEIPSKEIPYDTQKDSVLQKAARQLYGVDQAEAKLAEGKL